LKFFLSHIGPHGQETLYLIFCSIEWSLKWSIHRSHCSNMPGSTTTLFVPNDYFIRNNSSCKSHIIL